MMKSSVKTLHKAPKKTNKTNKLFSPLTIWSQAVALWDMLYPVIPQSIVKLLFG